jgi:amidase
MLRPMPLHDWGARELAVAIRDRTVSAVEVLRAHLDRIAEVNPQVNAIVTLADEDVLLAAARDADRAVAAGGPLGALHGLPVAVKDLLDTAGLRTTYGSPIFADHVPDADHLLVTRLRQAGAIIVGKTNTPEWGAGSQTFNPVFGATRNPHDLALTAGGSSGGAAAALAAGMVPLADGSDHGGSLRNPASFCGVVGLRPAPGRVPAVGGSDAWQVGGVLGPMARNVRDTGLLLSVLAGYDARDPIALADDPRLFADPGPEDLRGLRVAWSDTLGGLPVQAEVRAVLAGVRARLEAAGADLREDEPDLTGADEAFETLRAFGMVGSMGGLLEAHPERIKPTLRGNIEAGRRLTPERIARAFTLRTRLYERAVAFFGRADVLLAPTTQVVPFPVEQEYPTEIEGVALEGYLEWMRSCSRISAATLPAMSIPGGTTTGGLPVGVQLVGPPRGEERLLRIAAGIEAVLSPSVARRSPAAT